MVVKILRSRKCKLFSCILIFPTKDFSSFIDCRALLGESVADVCKFVTGRQSHCDIQRVYIINAVLVRGDWVGTKFEDIDACY